MSAVFCLPAFARQAGEAGLRAARVGRCPRCRCLQPAGAGFAVQPFCQPTATGVKQAAIAIAIAGPCVFFPGETSKNFRTVLLLLVVAAIAALAALNWYTLSALTVVSFGVLTLEAPLGLIMLGLTALLAAFFLAYVLSLHGSVLMDTRRHTKEMQVQRELADKAEASRFTELRTFLEAQHQRSHSELMERLALLESRVASRVQESDNSTAAYVGQLEQQMRTHKTDML